MSAVTVVLGTTNDQTLTVVRDAEGGAVTLRIAKDGRIRFGPVLSARNRVITRIRGVHRDAGSARGQWRKTNSSSKKGENGRGCLCFF